MIRLIALVRLMLQLILVVSVSVLPAYGFNNKGHRVVAAIAFEQLSEEGRQRVIEILKKHPRFQRDFENRMPHVVESGPLEGQHRWLFTQAGVWPDIAKGFQGSDRKRFNRPIWHFINIPIFLSDEHRQAMEGRITVNISRQFPAETQENELNIVQAYKKNLALLKNADATDADKAVAICWLFHLMADGHQPFHAAALFTPERQGNRITICGFSGR